MQICDNIIYCFKKVFVCLLFSQILLCQNKEANALINESSEYLLQHAYNPVDWIRWNDDVFTKSKKPNKLVIVSIGYSSCHWCHVMEKETFENSEVAEFMNSNFISIKVDREENPDIDRYYMQALELTTGNGGWPLNVVCLPNGLPVYAGTYHSKSQWLKVIKELENIYSTAPKKLYDFGSKLEQGIIAQNLIPEELKNSTFDKDVFFNSVEELKKTWDKKSGGITSNGPKFMLPYNLKLLMDLEQINPSDSLLKKHLIKSLDVIVKGKIFDPIEGGFFRYTVDSEWNIPHFEKMLYDNAQALTLMSEAYKKDNNPIYHERVKLIYSFLDKRLKLENGGFGASIDADNDVGEGVYYSWTREDVFSLFPNLDLFCSFYGIDWESPWKKGKYLLSNPYSISEFTEKNQLNLKRFLLIKRQWEKIIELELNKRNIPNVDQKFITSWNALAISGLCDAYNVFGTIEYLERAEIIFEFIKKNMMEGQQLFRTYQNGEKKITGFLVDYSFLIEASLSLYSTTGKEVYLTFAEELANSVIEKFKSSSSSLFKFSSKISSRPEFLSIQDGALPSANSKLAQSFYSLGLILGKQKFIDLSEQMIKSISPLIEKNMSRHSIWGSLYASQLFPKIEVVIIGRNAQAITKKILRENLFNILVVQSNKESELPLFANRFEEDKTLIYVCIEKVCRLPTEDIAVALKEIRDLSKKYPPLQFNNKM